MAKTNKKNHIKEKSPRRSRRLNVLQEDGSPVRRSLRISGVSPTTCGSDLNEVLVVDNNDFVGQSCSARRIIVRHEDVCVSKRSRSKRKDKVSHRFSKRLKADDFDESRPLVNDYLRNLSQNTSSKMNYNDGSLSPPQRRLSRRLNYLQEDGTPVRTSPRHRKTVKNYSSPSRNPVRSITQSARIPSRSKSKTQKKSMYDLQYFKDKRKSMFVSPTQPSKDEIEDVNVLKPILLDEENSSYCSTVNFECNLNDSADVYHSDIEEDNDSSINDEISVDSGYINNTESFDIGREPHAEATIQNESHIVENNNVKRICYCDKLPLPIDCNDCNRGSCIPCDKHTIIYCGNEDCRKPMHKGCIATYFGLDLNSMNDDDIMECNKCLSNGNNESEPWDSTDDDTKRVRFGLFPDQNINLVKKMKKILLEECDIPYNILDDIQNNDPKPHPSVTPITIEREDLHALCGRRFDLSMMMYSIHSCDCCGITKPLHRDRYYPDNAIFERKHFIQSFYKAWHCTCDGYCKEDQFYGSKQRSSIKLYRDNHNGLAPWEFLKVSKKETNAILCRKCNDEIKARNTIDLQFARSFSFRNGYGPAFIYPKSFEGEDPNFIIGRELQEIMTSLTCVEEAAIRQITPLVSLVRLSTGSISMKGNTSCVWQQSKLNIILPNLPTECKFVIIKRKGCTQSTKDIKSTKFERSKIERALELLSGTVDGIWKHSANFPIQISMEKLNAWPESGNLIDLLSDEEIIEKETEKESENDFNPVNVNINTDNGDAGPAPLQNTTIPSEDFEGIINFGESNESGNTKLASLALRKFVNDIRTNDQQSRNTEAIFEQQDVFNLGNFVNMNTTPYAWSRAFPSLFILSILFSRVNLDGLLMVTLLLMLIIGTNM